MRFIKLTKYHDKEAIYFNVASITSFIPRTEIDREYTDIYEVGNPTLAVKVRESVDEILALIREGI